MIEMSNVFNAQLAEKELFVLFLLLFVLKKEKRKKKCMGNKRKILNTSTCSKKKKKKKIGTPFDIVVFPYNQRNSDINSPCLHITF